MIQTRHFRWRLEGRVGSITLDRPERRNPLTFESYAELLATGPTFAHAMTKKMLHQEWNVGLDEAVEMEAQAQAICMQTKDFQRAYEAFAKKRKPEFQGD